jgi:hypothetical protein
MAARDVDAVLLSRPKMRTHCGNRFFSLADAYAQNIDFIGAVA